MKYCRPSLLSRTSDNAARSFRFPFLAIVFFVSTLPLLGQNPQPAMSDFVLFSGAGGPGTGQCYSPGYGVIIGSSSTINGGAVGSLKLIKTTGPVSITGNVFSRGTISLANSNLVTGNIAASNIPKSSGTVLSVGSNANLKGDIDADGKISIGGGTVLGKVTHPVGTSYTGPNPGGGNITGTPKLPNYPPLPPITSFPAYNSSKDINKTKTITPGSYGDIELTGNQTITLKGTGVYVFKEIVE